MSRNLLVNHLKIGGKYYDKTKNIHLTITKIMYKPSCQRVTCIDFDDITLSESTFCCKKIFSHASAVDTCGKKYILTPCNKTIESKT